MNNNKKKRYRNKIIKKCASQNSSVCYMKKNQFLVFDKPKRRQKQNVNSQVEQRLGLTLSLRIQSLLLASGGHLAAVCPTVAWPAARLCSPGPRTVRLSGGGEDVGGGTP